MRRMQKCLLALVASTLLFACPAIAQTDDCNDYTLATDYCSDQPGSTCPYGSILYITDVNCVGCGTESETQGTLQCTRKSTCVPTQYQSCACTSYPGYLVPTNNPNCSSGSGGGGDGGETCDIVASTPTQFWPSGGTVQHATRVLKHDPDPCPDCAKPQDIGDPVSPIATQTEGEAMTLPRHWLST
jgi:hypothetical protein